MEYAETFFILEKQTGLNMSNALQFLTKYNFFSSEFHLSIDNLNDFWENT